MYILAVFTFM